MKGICKYNKMINCMEQIKCHKCTWNPEYFEELKKKRRAEAKVIESEDSAQPGGSQLG